MTLPLEKTLGEARESVLLRVGIADSAAHNANLQRQVDEYLRDAHSYYYGKAGWFVAHRRLEVSLSEGVAEYDWPDDAQPGSVHAIYVSTDADKIPYELQLAPTPKQRYWATNGTTNGRPQYFEYYEGGIKLYPAPSSEYTVLVMDYKERQASLVSDSDRLQADSQLVIQRAVLDLKVHFGQQGVAEGKEHLREMERDILSRQNNRASWNMADWKEQALYGTRYRGRHKSTLGLRL